MPAAPNPLRLDPSRSAGLRRALIALFRARLYVLRRELVQLILKEDVFGVRADFPQHPQTIALTENTNVRTAETGGTLRAAGSVSGSADFNQPAAAVPLPDWEVRPGRGRWKPTDTDSDGSEARLRVESAPLALGETDWVDGAGPATNQRWAFLPSAEKLKAFGSWLRTSIARLLPAALGTRQVESAFSQGVQRAVREAGQRAAVQLVPTREQFFRSVAGQARAAEATRLLAERMAGEVQGVADELHRRLTATAADGLARRVSAQEISRLLTEQVDKTDYRLVRLARTEIVRAAATGQLEGLRELGIPEVGLLAEWTTAGNPCPQCAARAGERYTLDEAEGLIPLHPNCLCSWRIITGAQPPRRPPQEAVPAESVAGMMVEALALMAKAKKGVDVRFPGMEGVERMRFIRVDGVRIFWPEGEEETVALPLARILSEQKTLPPALWKTQSEIVFSAGNNPQDAYWAQQYGKPGFRSSATGGGGTTVLYEYGSLSRPGTFAHEAGHSLATKTWQTPAPSPSSAYGRAQAVEAPVTPYGALSPAEDFAEAVRLYANPSTRPALAQRNPKKFLALRDLLEAPARRGRKQ